MCLKKFVENICVRRIRNKYKNSPFAMSDLRRMQEKFVPKAQDVTLFYWLFSKSGFTKEVLEEAKRQGIQTVTVEDMV